MIWKRFNGSLIEDDISEEVEKTILLEQSNGNSVKICIGTDSQVYGEKIEFATVIVFVREKKGGFMFINKEKQHRIMSLKERMIYEVSKSVNIAYELSPIIYKHNIKLEVHADINPDPIYKSNTALNEAMGYIKGMGFDFKAKPNAFASSSCADKMI